MKSNLFLIYLNWQGTSVKDIPGMHIPSIAQTESEFRLEPGQHVFPYHKL